MFHWEYTKTYVIFLQVLSIPPTVVPEYSIIPQTNNTAEVQLCNVFQRQNIQDLHNLDYICSRINENNFIPLFPSNKKTWGHWYKYNYEEAFENSCTWIYRPPSSAEVKKE
jgi:hypothetical protein